MIREDLLRQLQEAVQTGYVARDEVLASHCSFRVGGPADLFVRVRTRQELSAALSLLRDAGIEVFLLGRGTNLLIGDGGFRGAVLTMCEVPSEKGENPHSRQEYSEESADPVGLSDVRIEGNTVYAGAGASLHRAAVEAARASLAGLAFAAGIPGTIGGGIVMNAGAYGGEMKQVVRQVCVLTEDLQVHTYDARQMDFGYRTSRLKREPGVVLHTVMELQQGSRSEIEARMADLARQRQEKQPLEYPSAGSTFKRPEGYFAGKLIEDAGLKGLRCGDAEVSVKHSGFIINRGGATAAQIRQLIEQVQRRVFEDAGVRLEREVIYLGEF